MKKKITMIALLSIIPVSAFAVDNVGECGWGSKVFEGQRGIAPQVLAVTTNGTFGNQTFGITSGTSGCTQDGVVKSNWKTAMFIDANANKLAKDISVGGGETLETLASLIGVEKEDKQLFFQTTKENFAKIFPSSEVTSKEIQLSLREVVGQNEKLAKYSAVI